jgi:hypothetical protein
MLSFKFWGNDQIFVEEFRVVPTRILPASHRGPGFDCLLGSQWMRSHPIAWIPRQWLRISEEAESKDEEIS